MSDKWDEMWKAWKDKHLAVLQEHKLDEAYIEKDFNRLFRMLEEYTPSPCPLKRRQT